jgi:S1-C subfamily serine protease
VARWRRFIGLVVALLALGACTNEPATSLAAANDTAAQVLHETTNVLQFSQLTSTEIIARNAAVKVIDPFRAGHGTGTYVKMYDRYVVVTAAHVVEDHSTMFIEGREGETVIGVVVYRDHNADLAIMVVPQIESRIAAPWRPCKNSRNLLGARVTYTGFPGRHDLVTLRGHVAALEHDMVVTNMFGWFGASGSGAFDQRGRFIGVVTGIDMGSWDLPPVPLNSIVWISPIWFLDKGVVKARVITADPPGLIKSFPGAMSPRRGGSLGDLGELK